MVCIDGVLKAKTPARVLDGNGSFILIRGRCDAIVN
jgi:hypothetical protein